MPVNEKVFVATSLGISLAMLIALVGIKHELEDQNRHLRALRGMAQKDAMKELESDMESE